MKDILRKSYDRQALEYENKFGALQRVKYEKIFAAAEGLFKGTSRLLDLGCGTGLFFDFLKAREALSLEAVGVDFSEKMGAVAEAKGYSFLRTDGETLPFREDSFDLIVSFTVLGILEEQDEGLLDEAARVLKNGGHFVVTLLKHKNLTLFEERLKARGFRILSKRPCGQDTGYVTVKGLE